MSSTCRELYENNLPVAMLREIRLVSGRISGLKADADRRPPVRIRQISLYFPAKQGKGGSRDEFAHDWPHRQFLSNVNFRGVPHVERRWPISQLFWLAVLSGGAAVPTRLRSLPVTEGLFRPAHTEA
jgi:hypothetical protein